MVKVYSIKQIAGKLGKTVRTIENYEKNGLIKFIRLKNRTKYCTESALKAFFVRFRKIS